MFSKRAFQSITAICLFVFGNNVAKAGDPAKSGVALPTRSTIRDARAIAQKLLRKGVSELQVSPNASARYTPFRKQVIEVEITHKRGTTKRFFSAPDLVYHTTGVAYGKDRLSDTYGRGRKASIPRANVPELKAYFAKVEKISQFIVDTMQKHGVSVSRLKESPNYFYNQIAANGGIAVEYYYGSPSKIWTPLGYYRVTGSASYSGTQMMDAVAEISSRLGLKEIVPLHKGQIGDAGPVMMATRDLQGNQLPSVQPIAPGAQMNYKTAEKLWKSVASAGRDK